MALRALERHHCVEDRIRCGVARQTVEKSIWLAGNESKYLETTLDDMLKQCVREFWDGASNASLSWKVCVSCAQKVWERKAGRVDPRTPHTYFESTYVRRILINSKY